jgi:hypothetical protein
MAIGWIVLPVAFMTVMRVRYMRKCELYQGTAKYIMGLHGVMNCAGHGCHQHGAIHMASL